MKKNHNVTIFLKKFIFANINKNQLKLFLKQFQRFFFAY